MEITITVKRGDESKTYQLTEIGESKKGTFKLFAAKENADLPDFAKVYVKATRDKAAKAAKATNHTKDVKILTASLQQ